MPCSRWYTCCASVPSWHMFHCLVQVHTHDCNLFMFVDVLDVSECVWMYMNVWFPELLDKSLQSWPILLILRPLPWDNIALGRTDSFGFSPRLMQVATDQHMPPILHTTIGLPSDKTWKIRWSLCPIPVTITELILALRCTSPTKHLLLCIDKQTSHTCFVAPSTSRNIAAVPIRAHSRTPLHFYFWVTTTTIIVYCCQRYNMHRKANARHPSCKFVGTSVVRATSDDAKIQFLSVLHNCSSSLCCLRLLLDLSVAKRNVGYMIHDINLECSIWFIL